jgi:hypothetical protein
MRNCTLPTKGIFIGKQLTVIPLENGSVQTEADKCWFFVFLRQNSNYHKENVI